MPHESIANIVRSGNRKMVGKRGRNDRLMRLPAKAVLPLNDMSQMERRRPTRRTANLNINRSPKMDGLEKWQSRWSVGVPIFRSMINPRHGNPMSVQNSSTTPFMIFR
jgi:hypothetical protein